MKDAAHVIVLWGTEPGRNPSIIIGKANKLVISLTIEMKINIFLFIKNNIE